MKTHTWKLIVIGTAAAIIGIGLNLAGSIGFSADIPPPSSTNSGSVKVQLSKGSPLEAEIEAIPSLQTETQAGLSPQAGSQGGVQVRLRPRSKPRALPNEDLNLMRK